MQRLNPKNATDAPAWGGVVLAHEEGSTMPSAMVAYDNILELLEVLTVALTNHRRREARAVESRALAEAAFPGIGALLMK